MTKKFSAPRRENYPPLFRVQNQGLNDHLPYNTRLYRTAKLIEHAEEMLWCQPEDMNSNREQIEREKIWRRTWQRRRQLMIYQKAHIHALKNRGEMIN